MSGFKHTVAFDFDGVIHQYRYGWNGVTVIDDIPVYGIDELINKLRLNGYEVIVYTVRASDPEGKVAVIKWLEEHGISVDGVTCEKPPALCYLDDRAICFEGNTQTLYDKIVNFRPWYWRTSEGE